MQKLYKKSELLFAVVWIIVYVVGTSVADSLSNILGLAKALTFTLHIIMSALAFSWIKDNGLLKKYGICKTTVKASRYLYYIPLMLLATVNLWFGVRMNMPIHEALLYVGSMICVGFLEELIFRGFLFKAMAKDNLKSAIIVSSLTFGIGHIVNLINGSGADLVSNLCQICYAVAFGYLFVIIFHRGQSLLPCILTHSVINALSAFSNTAALTGTVNIIVSVILCAVALGYAFILRKTLPKADQTT